MAGVSARLTLFALLLGGLFVVLAAWFPPGAAQAQSCATGGGDAYDFEAYEAERDRFPYLIAQRLAAQNLLLPSDPAFSLPPIQSGNAQNRQIRPGATIPGEILQTIGWIESHLNQAARHVPYQSVGEALRSFDCGYGIMQVTSFFSHHSDVPSREEALVGTHYAYNMAKGAQILMEKWNSSIYPVVAEGDPAYLESWYYALWAYNGFAFQNHPTGTSADPFRSLPYSCRGPRNGYPYQELVLGCVSNSPLVDTVQLWGALPVQLPDLATLTLPGGPLDVTTFFAGLSLLDSVPFSGGVGVLPFLAMALPLPATAVAPPNPSIDPSAAAEGRAQIFGAPILTVDTTALHLEVTEQSVELGAVTISNPGLGLLVYRVAPDVPWIDVDIDAGIAVGSDWPVREGSRRTATITVRPRADGLSEGIHQGLIMVEALLPDGSVQSQTVVVELDKSTVPRFRAGEPRS